MRRVLSNTITTRGQDNSPFGVLGYVRITNRQSLKHVQHHL